MRSPPACAIQDDPNLLRPLIRILRMTGLVLTGVLTAKLFYRRMDRADRDRHVLAWAGKLMRILNIELRLRGAPPVGGAVLVANHVSWLDIHVLHSMLPVHFISKAEVRDWPLLGDLARASGTLFITRERKADAIRVNQEMAAELAAGECLAFFPEGTTSDGQDMRPFFPSLFQPAVDAGCPVIPAAIRYFNRDGAPCVEAAYHGGMTLLGSFWSVARLPGLVVQVTFLPALSCAGRHRRDIAKQAEAAIRDALGFAADKAAP
jgi:1-acyl-sn-glycerol-3-phosphate acyltransferase